MRDLDEELRLHRACFGVAAPTRTEFAASLPITTDGFSGTVAGVYDPARGTVRAVLPRGSEVARALESGTRPVSIGGRRWGYTLPDGTSFESARDHARPDAPLPPTPAWAQLARLAMHAYQHESTLVAERGRFLVATEGPARRGYNMAFSSVEEPPQLYETDADAEFTFAESMMILMAERASELQRDGAKALSNERWSASCRACGAAPGERCTPLHDGERPPGSWCHPIRGMPEAANVGDVGTYKLAYEIVHNGVLGSDSLRGLPQGVRESLMHLAREVLACDALRTSGYVEWLTKSMSNAVFKELTNAPPTRWTDDRIDVLSSQFRETYTRFATGEALERIAADLDLQRARRTHSNGITELESDESLRERCLIVLQMRSAPPARFETPGERGMRVHREVEARIRGLHTDQLIIDDPHVATG